MTIFYQLPWPCNYRKLQFRIEKTSMVNYYTQLVLNLENVLCANRYRILYYSQRSTLLLFGLRHLHNNYSYKYLPIVCTYSCNYQPFLPLPSTPSHHLRNRSLIARREGLKIGKKIAGQDFLRALLPFKTG